MKASIRVHSLTLGGSGPKTLHAMELHGKRRDQTSLDRHVREVEPLVFGSLNLRAAYDEHVEGTRKSAGLKRPVLHALIQFPIEIELTPKREELLLYHAVEFIQQSHGRNAVFAARLDRDEAGRHSVDVFFAPKYVKITKDRKGQEVHTTWSSTTKHGRDLALKHQAKIKERHLKSTGILTGPRHVGIALQEELSLYLQSIGLKLEHRTLKPSSQPDRVEPEVYKMRKEAAANLEAAAVKGAEIVEKSEMQAKAAMEAAAVEGARIGAEAALHVLSGELFRTKAGKWSSKSSLPKSSLDELKPIFSAIGPTLNRLADWWGKFRKRVEALPPDEQPQNIPLDLNDDENHGPSF